MATKFLPIPNVGTQIERAVLALLRDAYDDYGTNLGVKYFHSNSAETRSVPLVDCLAHKSTETVPFSGIESFMVRLDWIYDGAVEVSQTNTDADWKAIDEFVGIGMAALSQTAGNNGDPDTLSATVSAEITRLGRQLAVDYPDNHADMAKFTCTYVEYKGSIRAESVNGTLFLKEIRNFEIRAVPANVD